MSFGYQVLGFGSGGAAAAFVAATGGTESTCGDYKIHLFTGPGALCVSCAGNAAGSSTLDYLVVAGGGGGTLGCNAGGAGGAGGFRYFAAAGCTPGAPALPLNGPAGLAASVACYTVTVGAGGALQNAGLTSSFSSCIASAGGARGAQNTSGFAGGSGGGGGSKSGCACYPGGAGNDPATTPDQGTPGGIGRHRPGVGEGGGGGGGALVAGGRGDAPCATGIGGTGGAGGGLPSGVFGTNGESCGSYRYYAGGAGGGGNTGGPGGLGGAGNGGGTGGGVSAGSANTGGGGGGTYSTIGTPGAGGSGIVVIRYKFQ